MLLVCGGAAAALFLAAGAATVLAIWPHFVGLERREAEHQTSTALRVIQAEEDRLSELANTNGVWDEPFDFLRGTNPHFAEINLNPDALDQIEVDAALLFRNDGSAAFRGLRHASFHDALPELERAMLNAPTLALDDAHPRRTALVSVGRRVVIVSLRRVVKADGSGASPGVLAFAREISPSVLSRMTALGGIQFRLLPAGGSARRSANLRAQAPVKDAWGQESLALEVVGKPELLHLGRTTVIGLALTMLAVVAALTCAFAYALVAAVINPVRVLIRTVDAAARGDTIEGPAHRPPAEIAELAAAFEAAFEKSRTEALLHKAAREEAIAARAAAERDAQAKSRFLATMSHELRTPLNAVIGYTEMLQEAAVADGRAGEGADFDRVLSAARALLNLINSILDFARLENGRMPILAEEFEVADLAGSVADIARPLVAEKRLTFVVDVAPDAGAARSDPTRISQCLVNVLANAVKFTAAGEVRFRVSREREDGADWLHFAIEDTGIGMSPEQLQRVFEPFTQADETIARRYGGAGLGLTITSELLSRLGGRIEIKTELGSGARVVLMVPAHLPDAAAAIALKPAA